MNTKKFVSNNNHLYEIIKENSTCKICSEVDRQGNLLPPKNDIKISNHGKVYGSDHWVTWNVDPAEFWPEHDRRLQTESVQKEMRREQARLAEEKRTLKLQAVKDANPGLMQSFQKEIMPNLNQIKFQNSRQQDCLMLFSVSPTIIYIDKWTLEMKEIEGVRIHNVACWSPDNWGARSEYRWSNPSGGNMEAEHLEDAIYEIICDFFWN